MTDDEAAQAAQRIFGDAAVAVTAKSGMLQMKATLQPAYGIGFRDGSGALCVQGKGVTWEAAFKHLESRRPKWEAKHGTHWPGKDKRRKRKRPHEKGCECFMCVDKRGAVLQQKAEREIARRKAKEDKFRERLQRKVKAQWG